MQNLLRKIVEPEHNTFNRNRHKEDSVRQKLYTRCPIWSIFFKNFRFCGYNIYDTFIQILYKPDFRALLLMFVMTWIKNGLCTLKWFLCGCRNLYE